MYIATQLFQLGVTSGQNWLLNLGFKWQEMTFSDENRVKSRNPCYFLSKQAWKLSAIKGKPNLSILWEVRLFNNIWQKDNFLPKNHLCPQNKFKLDKSILAEKYFLLNSNFCQKDISGKTKICPKSHFWLKSQFRLKSRFWPKEPILAKKP